MDCNNQFGSLLEGIIRINFNRIYVTKMSKIETFEIPSKQKPSHVKMERKEITHK